jgi:hypothetical protein
MVELNKCWHLLKESDKWKDQTRGWWESSHSNLGYNRNDNSLSSSFQPGGTAVISVGSMCHWAIASGRDTTGFGC